MSLSPAGRRALVVLGAGRAGGGLAVLLACHGWPPVAIWSRSRTAAARVARRIATVAPGNRPRATIDLAGAVGSARILMVAVPDDALQPFAHRIARLGSAASGGVALHLSGVHPASALAPMGAAGWEIGALHPLAIFPVGIPPRDLLAGAAMAVEGSATAVGVARALARLLGAAPFPLAPAARPAYHLAAALVANDTVGLMALALDLAHRAGVPAARARRGLAHLLAGTARSLTRDPPGRALTGPVVRGDDRTLRRHLAVAGPPPTRRIHLLLSRVLVELARQAGRIDDATARRLTRVLAGSHRRPGQG